MKFSDIPGNEAAVAALRRMVSSGRIPHAMLFYENEGGGGFALASAWVQYLNCNRPVDGEACGRCPSCQQMAKMEHPDVHYVFPVNTGDAIKSSVQHPTCSMALNEFRQMALANPFFNEQDLYQTLGVESKSGLISVYDAKEIIDTLNLSSVQDGYKAVIMFLPERMNAAAANKLLKILEEPPSQTVFVLITNSPEDVMGTIFSRCQPLRVLPFSRGDALSGAGIDKAMQDICFRLLDAVSRRDLFGALQCAQEVSGIKSREKQKSFCIFASGLVRKILMCRERLEDIAYLDDACAAAVRDLAGRFTPAFCVSAAAALDGAAMLVGRNVSAAMIFTDLVDRLYNRMQ